MRSVPLLACFIAGCASAPAPVTTPAAPASATPAPAEEVCTASSVRTAPEHLWPQVGTIVVTVQQGKPVSLELRNTTGQIVDTVKVAAGQDLHALLEQATCRLGGVLYQPPAGKPADGPVELKVLHAAKPSEPDDLRRLCSQPEMPDGFDPSQQVRVAVQLYDENLTSPKWRTWMHRFKKEMHAASGDAGAIEVKKKYGAELASAASGASVKDCWFAVRLQ